MDRELPTRDEIAEILFNQRQTCLTWDPDADSESDLGQLVSICRDDADAVLALFNR